VVVRRRDPGGCEHITAHEPHVQEGGNYTVTLTVTDATEKKTSLSIKIKA
jgi:hypothetical protein